MINSNTSFGKLKEVIVGRELNVSERTLDITVKYFYKESLDQDIYEKPFDKYEINYELLKKRQKELDDLANTLTSLGVKVYRPKEIKKAVSFQTPTFKSTVSSASNVRDITLVYKNTIIETPTFVRNRYYENMAMYDIFNDAYDMGKGGLWIKSPNVTLTENSLDMDDWKNKRDFSNIDKRFDMAIDGAQFLRIGKDVIVNVTTYNHYLGYMWVKSLFPESNFHMVSIVDNHIDGALICLKPGYFLVNPKIKGIENILPEKFRNWKYLYPTDKVENIDVHNMTDLDIRLASSRGMDINVLSVDENTVIVNKRAKGVIEVLENNGFNVIQVTLDNGEIFAGGIHCSTLDLVREDEYISYT